MPENAAPLPDFTRWPSFPFEGDMRVKDLAPPVAVEPPRSGEDASDCVACNTPDDAYIWENERWRVRAMDRPTGLPMVLILECRSHLDMGDLPNLLAAELGVMTVRLERAIRSLDGVARVHVNRWGDGSAHLHMWFLARPYGRLQLRGTFLSLWDDILPTIPEDQWRENLALVGAWLAEFGGHANTEPAHIQWQSPSTLSAVPLTTGSGSEYAPAFSAEPTVAPPADGHAAQPEPATITVSDRAPDATPNSAEADSDPAVAEADSDPAAVAGTDAENTDSPGAIRAESMTRSGSDHATSSVDRRSAVTHDDGDPGILFGAARTEAGYEAKERDAVTVRNAESEDVGEHSSREGGAASVWVADAGKGLWRPSDLGEAERVAPAAGAKAEVVRGDQNEATSSDRPASIPGPDTDTRGTSSAGGTDRGALDAVGTAEDQTDASAETAGTRRS